MKDEDIVGWWHSCVTDKAMGAFFNAADLLYTVRPWQQVPHHSCLIHMMVPSIGKRTWVVSVLGQEAGDSQGIMLFDHVHAFKRYEQIYEAAEAGIEPKTIPAYDLLHFEDSNDVPESIRRIVTENGWWDADNDVFPTALKIDPNLSAAPAHLSDVVFLETMTRALAKALESPERWHRAWQGGEPVEMTLPIETSDGMQEVVLGSELSQGFDLFTGSDSELLAAFAEIDGKRGSRMIDFDELDRLERSLMSRVAACPEALELEDPTLGLGMLLDLADQLFVTVTDLDAKDLEQMLFYDIPSSVMLGSDSAQTLLTSIQFAYEWMTTRYPLEHGADYLDLLNNIDIGTLETRLVDPKLFGRRKTKIIADLSTDFDTTTKEGLNKMMRTVFAGSSAAQTLVLEEPPNMMPPGWKPQNPALTSKQKQKRKVNRKAARKARKKNR